jgi:hypothetical protein
MVQNALEKKKKKLKTSDLDKSIVNKLDGEGKAHYYNMVEQTKPQKQKQKIEYIDKEDNRKIQYAQNLVYKLNNGIIKKVKDSTLEKYGEYIEKDGEKWIMRT